MDHEHRMAAAKLIDGQLAGRIIRNLGQIEADFFHSAWPLSERLMHEAFLAISQVAQAPWECSEVEWSTRIVCPEWKMTKGVGTGDMRLELGELSADPDGYEHSWLAAALKAAPTQLCIAVKFRRGLQDFAEGLLQDEKAIAGLKKAGFKRDDDQGVLYVPFDIPAEIMAAGFEQNDLSKAIQPIGKAAALALAAKPELDKLLEQVRAAAKRK
ncbi:hypothetical protein GGR39_003234 [Novosphingobium fluoreni]|uniref:Uncharacterized protein n=1 Tax=Novosphingobium fluoreni TaxID=1391222 RepID=A0A7W6C150_9SPHN|nr:hypothetical protein [Novosphingobium fluoreni]MBB3941554.1 hypothetical protein [Novosphingobium fluoreni]